MPAKPLKPSAPGTPMAKKKTKPPAGLATSTERAKRHLDRLAESKGKRLLVDLDALPTQMLEALKAHGYGDTNKAVVSRALMDAARKRKLVEPSREAHQKKAAIVKSSPLLPA